MKDNIDKKPEIIETKIPENFEEFVLEKGKLKLDDQEYTYAVMDQEGLKGKFGDRIPVMFASGDRGMISISENYPEEYRELGLKHEIYEFFTCDSNKPTCCLESLKKELVIAKEEVGNIAEYVTFRRKFFGDLITFYEGQPDWDGKEQFLNKLRLSFDYLCDLEKSGDF
jgi:hypothetical protein